jgi:hypothetical protein
MTWDPYRVSQRKGSGNLSPTPAPPSGNGFRDCYRLDAEEGLWKMHPASTGEFSRRVMTARARSWLGTKRFQCHPPPIFRHAADPPAGPCFLIGSSPHVVTGLRVARVGPRRATKPRERERERERESKRVAFHTKVDDASVPRLKAALYLLLIADLCGRSRDSRWN